MPGMLGSGRALEQERAAGIREVGAGRKEKGKQQVTEEDDPGEDRRRLYREGSRNSGPGAASPGSCPANRQQLARPRAACGGRTATLQPPEGGAQWEAEAAGARSASQSAPSRLLGQWEVLSATRPPDSAGRGRLGLTLRARRRRFGAPERRPGSGARISRREGSLGAGLQGGRGGRARRQPLPTGSGRELGWRGSGAGGGRPSLHLQRGFAADGDCETADPLPRGLWRQESPGAGVPLAGAEGTHLLDRTDLPRLRAGFVGPSAGVWLAAGPEGRRGSLAAAPSS